MPLLVANVAILHDELYRKRFLPVVTDTDLQRLAEQALREPSPQTNKLNLPVITE